MRHFLLLASASAVLGSPAMAQPRLDLGAVMASVDGDYLSYGGDRGSRRTVNARTQLGLGETKVHLGVSQGQRRVDGDKMAATRVSGALVRDWSPSVSTRTSVGLSSNQPVFVRREVAQDLIYKPAAQTLLTAGARYANYFGGVDVLSWSLGAAQYFDAGMVSYRFSAFKIEDLGNSVGHLASAKLNDAAGSTQLWVGHGTAIHDPDWLATPAKGKLTSVELRRSLRVSKAAALSVGIKRSWYDTPAEKFRATGLHAGVTINP